MIESKLVFPIAGEVKLGGYGGKIIEYTLDNQLMDAETWALLVEQFRLKDDSLNKGWRGEYPAGKNNPDKITNRMTVKVGNRITLEGPDRILSNLNKLKTCGNADNGSAKSNAYYKMQSCHPESENQKPENISYKFHVISS